METHAHIHRLILAQTACISCKGHVFKRHDTHNKCVQRAFIHGSTHTHTFTYANRMRNGIRDFRKDKFPWRIAMDYWLV